MLLEAFVSGPVLYQVGERRGVGWENVDHDGCVFVDCEPMHQGTAKMATLGRLPMPGLLSWLDAKLSGHPASRVEGIPAETSAAQEEATLAGEQAADLLCRDVLRLVLCREGPKGGLGTASLDADGCPSLEEEDFFKLLDEDAAISEGDVRIYCLQPSTADLWL